MRIMIPVSVILLLLIILFQVIGTWGFYQEEPHPTKSLPQSQHLTEASHSEENCRSETEPVQTEDISTVPSPIESENTVPIAEYRPVDEWNFLFIGDSRTVGLADYAYIEEASYFATVGMSVYNVWDARVSMPQIGKVTLDELLNNRKYDIIYIMLGINELGYDFVKTVDHYKSLVDSVKACQPDALIILMANIHVTADRSASDRYINNPAIDRFNEATSCLADQKTVFYLDANELFDDENRNLAAEKSADSAHLKAKYCVEWADWIIIETADIIVTVGEGERD